VPPTGSWPTEWQQKKLTQYIDEHLAEDVSLSSLAELVHLSPYHFSRAFKQSFNMPPHRYLTNRRKSAAARHGRQAARVHAHELASQSDAERFGIGGLPLMIKIELPVSPGLGKAYRS
jgi:AraC-like DNA-binding protein